MAANEKYRLLKAGEVVLPTDEVYVGYPVDKWMCGSLNCGKKLPAKYVGAYRRLDIKEGKIDTAHNKPSAARKARPKSRKPRLRTR